MPGKSVHVALLTTLAALAAGCGGGSSSSADAGPTTRGAARVPGLHIDSLHVAATEEDPAGRLSVRLENTGARPLEGLAVYYVVTDRTTGDHESYFRQLGALSIAPGGKRTVYFDLVRSSPNTLVVEVTVSARGSAVQTARVKTDVG